MSNDDVIARGGGSPQARWDKECCKGGDCPVCNPAPSDEHPDPDCERCKGEGYYSVPNGPDDFDHEICECVQDGVTCNKCGLVGPACGCEGKSYIDPEPEGLEEAK